MAIPAVLAATIVFQGLVLHVQTDATTNSKRAVLVKPSHTAQLIVSDAHRIDATGPWTVVQTGTSGANARPWIYDVSDLRLRVVTNGTKVTQTPAFDSYVPSLRESLTAPDRLHPEIESGNAHVPNKTATYLDYTGGTLDVQLCWPKGGSFVPPLPGEPRCFARDVRFTPEVDGDWQITDGERTLTLRRSSVVRIKNESTQSGQHHHHYSDLLVGGTRLRDMKESDLLCGKTTCTLEGIRQPGDGRGANISCSNNQWP